VGERNYSCKYKERAKRKDCNKKIKIAKKKLDIVKCGVRVKEGVKNGSKLYCNL
jgi:hypothetical protein